jgi:RND superfamily putative drug exporter
MGLGSRVLSWVVERALRAPRLTLVVWLVATAVLAVLGLNVQSRLTESAFVLPGTPSAAATALANERFGESITIPVLLHGPSAAVRVQTTRLAHLLGREPATTVLSPYGLGQSALAPRPGVAMMIVSVRRPLNEGIDIVAPEVRREVARTVRAPVRAAVTGLPVAGADLKQTTFAAATSAELIAVVVLLVVLLLVFRTPGAALVPAAFGLSNVLSAYGVLSLLSHFVALDSVAATLCSMMGLALGVDYSLLLVSRFREQLPGSTPPAAARAAVLTAGRTVLFAGGALTAAMIVALELAPGALLFSAVIGVLITAMLGMLAAVTAVPAALCVLGERIERWPLRGGQRPGVAAITAPLRRHPKVLAAVILAALLACATPALGLHTGPPGVDELPAGTRALTDFQTVSRIMGPGWASPFQVIAATDRGTITTKPLLRALERFQSKLAANPRVAAVIGPGELTAQLTPLNSAASHLKQTEHTLNTTASGATRLQHGLSQATGGLHQLNAGLAAAATGAGSLSAGTGTAQSGSGQIAAGLATASTGAVTLSNALARVRAGAGRIRAGIATARAGAGVIASALGTAAGQVRAALPQVRALSSGLNGAASGLTALNQPASTTQDDLIKGFEQLNEMGLGKLDPHYRAAITDIAQAAAAATGRDPRNGQQLNPGYAGLAAAVTASTAGIQGAANGTATLTTKLGQLADGLEPDRVPRRRGL